MPLLTPLIEPVPPPAGAFVTETPVGAAGLAGIKKSNCALLEVVVPLPVLTIASV